MLFLFLFRLLIFLFFLSFPPFLFLFLLTFIYFFFFISSSSSSSSSSLLFLLHFFSCHVFCLSMSVFLSLLSFRSFYLCLSIYVVLSHDQTNLYCLSFILAVNCLQYHQVTNRILHHKNVTKNAQTKIFKFTNTINVPYYVPLIFLPFISHLLCHFVFQNFILPLQFSLKKFQSKQPLK